MDTVDCQAQPNQVEQYLRGCPVRTVLEVFANKWTVLVMVNLHGREGPVRFNELGRALDGVTQKMLTQTLRTLEREGLISRTVYPTVPPRVEYALTKLGVDAGRLLGSIGKWSEENIEEILASRESFDTRAALGQLPVRS
ncbi:helix-turn-helix domain-containing protein [Amycolatopsis sp.]|jgi:DNA-binding HxlR family transcriptional regulator|uniref:winged helix-turn-helix transcriptional regulator n=1 Tax=Amycolatopsis sp. TaxID=37632 RepID=UPI002DFB949A|nr:helix-turn-helix domain-containing protein [Amycolatopsis sp.]